jgi:hypothetical protein
VDMHILYFSLSRVFASCSLFRVFVSCRRLMSFMSLSHVFVSCLLYISLVFVLCTYRFHIIRQDNSRQRERLLIEGTQHQN